MIGEKIRDLCMVFLDRQGRKQEDKKDGFCTRAVRAS